MICTIVSPDDILKIDNAVSVTLPAQGGQATILPHHAEAYFALEAGTLTIEGDHQYEKNIDGGLCSVIDDVITVVL